MKPAQSSYLAWRMKSTESSAGVAPSLETTQSGALSISSAIYLTTSRSASRKTPSDGTSVPSGSTIISPSLAASGM